MHDASSPDRFPPTRWSAIRASAELGTATREQAFSRLVAAYWRPVYIYLRLRHHRDGSTAYDLTQSFFARCWEKNTLASFDPGRARFRTFMRLCVDGHVIDQQRGDHARKRGLHEEHVPIDVPHLEREAALIDPALTSERSTS